MKGQTSFRPDGCRNFMHCPETQNCCGATIVTWLNHLLPSETATTFTVESWHFFPRQIPGESCPVERGRMLRQVLGRFRSCTLSMLVHWCMKSFDDEAELIMQRTTRAANRTKWLHFSQKQNKGPPSIQVSFPFARKRERKDKKDQNEWQKWLLTAFALPFPQFVAFLSYLVIVFFFFSIDAFSLLIMFSIYCFVYFYCIFIFNRLEMRNFINNHFSLRQRMAIFFTKKWI